MNNKQIDTSLGFIMGLEQILNYLVEHNQYMAQIGNINIKYLGKKEDSFNAREKYLKFKGKWRSKVYE